jgi:tryptophan-rich sensory protein
MTRHAPTSRGRALLALFGFLVVCFAVSAIGGWMTAGSVDTWYRALAKPSFNPPDWIFAPVWSVLYAMIALAGWRVWRRTGFVGRGSAALAAWGVQLVLNLAWSCVFFGLRNPGAALMVILALLAAIVVTLMLMRRVDRPAALLFVPYLLWVGFATVLNASIWILN